ncbi:IclR family transcriptional regulator [Leucobacter triazinivorans]|uniref:Glycerol operon regulatory protein n=1 Tax=Leucobacter triazinivorans TaxID=1784719 RepID=A0A4P6KIG7_9MICO|nr:IclR family transcriptional regulator [Leucobacter triazinivorans]QBE49364.1 IclR family transcriptional regulator [Leucobacter triazinivorans]
MSEAAAAGSGEGAGGVQSVVRAFGVLEAVAELAPEAALVDIARATGLAQSTAHRLLQTMVNAGYVRQTEARGYALGAALISLGTRATPPLALRARSVMVELEALAQETVNLAVLDGDRIAYVGQVPSRHQMRMFTEIGHRVLPHSAGVGKAILSTLPETRVREIVAVTGLPRFTATTLTDVESLLADLRAVRRRGFAIDDGEHEVGVRCIAVPLPGASPPAAISISGPAARVNDELAATIAEALVDAARSLA